MIDFSKFEEIEMHVGTIIKVEKFENAKKPAFKLYIDFGTLGIKKSSAQITQIYHNENLIGKQIVAITNFRPKQIAHFMSECLVLGVNNKNNNVVLIQPDFEVENGSRIY